MTLLVVIFSICCIFFIYCFADSTIFVIVVEVIGCHGSTYSANSNGSVSVPVDISSETITVDLSHNSIINLTSGVFSHLTLCTKLDLSINQISLIESGSFAGLSSLTSLDLSNNRITSLTSGVFSDIPACALLDLSFNQITGIESGVFAGLFLLTVLDLSNPMSTLQQDVFSSLINLDLLSLRVSGVTG